MHLKFIEWRGEEAIFKEANITDKVICAFGLNVLCRALNIKEGDIILIHTKYLPKKPLDRKGVLDSQVKEAKQ